MSLSLADRASLIHTFGLHRSRLLEAIRRRIDPVLGRSLDAEDVLQDAYFDAERKWKNFQKNRGLTEYAWLYRVCRDRLIEHYRRQTRQKRDIHRMEALPARSSVDLGVMLIGKQSSPSQAARKGELRELVAEALKQLDPQDREILWMRHYDGLTQLEIAGVLDISHDAAKKRCYRAIKRFTEKWDAVAPSDDSIV